ncbi:hypothetical protein H5410_062502 [Solanum commersonii]|uniref:Uncharacterized protein n=1 Tax=Solanum commersonii TaxID=4109 RepID=A0A9J5WCI3_SOLCO|nr:hypothetical protein H5410_062502 [Solanum commersonii]
MHYKLNKEEMKYQNEVYEIWDDIKFKDKKIVWSPMVIIMNMTLEKDDNDMWIGWDILSCMILVFEATVVGYMEALLLIEQFSKKKKIEICGNIITFTFFRGKHHHIKKSFGIQQCRCQRIINNSCGFRTKPLRITNTFEETFCLVNEKHHHTAAENKIVGEKIDVIKQSFANSFSTIEDHRVRVEKSINLSNFMTKKWKCLWKRGWDGIKFKDKKIVWPPILIIMNTTFEKDDNDKWIGWDIWSCMKIFSSYISFKDFVIQNDHEVIVASGYWFLWPVSWDTRRLYFSLSCFLN